MNAELVVTDREGLLSRWIKPSSDTEDEQQKRAERMVKAAVDRSPVAAKAKVYAKGSYPNSTNVRRDSDVDIVVECCEVYFHDGAAPSSSTPKQRRPKSLWWPPEEWRSTVHSLLQDHFGRQQVDADHNVAFNIPAVDGSRPSIDVVPSYEYRAYRRLDGAGDPAIGSLVWCKDGKKIVNWPKQQLVNGRNKNTSTGHRYKNMVRALKNAENELVRLGRVTEQPSYLMECLVYNVPDPILKRGHSLDDTFRAALTHLIEGTLNDVHKSWAEPNEIKPLFGAGQKWSVDDAHKLVVETFYLLNYV
ncbi:nucleotidyltransferase family protein [Streptomyces luteolus]|uniref:cGAS/DncV-like nucleotidyltransferase C-terminal helical domain-containing protein n=1 Tax=Streptomyces luteolus TaxID=3043615 RepID=A0ABT6SXI2_9ACTN|nr:hypothetical protein [Streptomyces sp. B-S-A12]MDI3420318.1 hypothetical protein [Streptomyces sp. B-S-A12]